MSAWPKDWASNPGYRSLFRRLMSSHGLERAADIVAGIDQSTNADLQKWRALGREKAA